MQIDEKQIRKSLAILKPDNELFEIRIIGNDRSNYSGYFTDAETLIEQLKRVRIAGNTYFTLNYLNEACYSRKQRDVFVKNAKETTSDNDVEGYEWLMIDLDPKRPAGTSSTDKQIEDAKAIGNKIYAFMAQIGFETPLTAYSGNGVHLLYKVALDNCQENKKLLETALKTLSMLFSTKEIEVDKKNFNPSRICKLYGTMAQKGASTEDRPHRMSCVIGNPQDIKATDIEYIKKLCSKYPKEPEKPQKYNNYSPRDFNLDEWLGKYGLKYKKEDAGGVTKFILDCCPFDSNHKGKDAVIFQGGNGAIGFNCFHNSCADKTWRDVRLLFEPDAYEKKEAYRQKMMYGSFNRNRPPEKRKPIEKEEGVPIFLTAMDVYNMPKIEETFIKTGIDVIDKKMRGLKKGALSVVSGLRASGKTSLLTEIILNAIDTGNNVGCFSGELVERNFMRWMNQMAAGKSKVAESKYNDYYYTPDNVCKEIAEWLGERFWLYNNKYGNDFVNILTEFDKIIDKNKLDFLVLDNLMAFNISGLSDNKWDAQSEFVLMLAKLAKEKNIHILFVAHPRKTMGFLRLEEISGTGDLANAVDDAFIVHRNNNDFKKRSKEMFGWKDDNDIYSGTNVVEIAKNRDGGVQDVFVPLYYEQQTRRLRNYPYENRIYGWDKGGGSENFIDIGDDSDAPPFD